MSKKNAIAPTREENFPEWYQKVIQAADLAENSETRGCMVIKPWGYALWENIQGILDKKFKETGHENAYFPLLIPLSYLEKEAEHAEGFATECAVVTHHRLEAEKDESGKTTLIPKGKLTEPYVIRPTSEMIIGAAFSRWTQSYRDLPLLINQWANVMRWEMRPRIFLRTAEFLWQEGHTAHATQEEAEIETSQMHEIYEEFLLNYLAIPVIAGEKSEVERFPGADKTLTVEAMVQDKKAIQAGTSHYLGQNFAKAQNISFVNKEGDQEFAYTTSWGVSTRLIGTLIMAHSDDDGLLMPPAVASQQVVIIPVIPKSEFEEAVLEACESLKSQILRESYLGQTIKVKIDKRDSNAGTKKWEWVKKGVPIRVEIGPRDLEKGKLCYQLRTQEPTQKHFVESQDWASKIPDLLASVHQDLLSKATELRDNHMVYCDNISDFEKNWADNGSANWLITPWAGSNEEEEELSKKWQISIRCLPDSNKIPTSIVDKIPEVVHCLKTGIKTKKLAIWAKSY